jgi:putative transcriptional regulator
MNYERVAENLINLRNGRSREEVAKSSGNPSISTLQMYENGQRIPRDNKKIKLAKFYGVTVQTIFFDSEQHEVC